MCRTISRGGNASEIAFIVCTNNKSYIDECRFYIGQLYVPEGMTISLLMVEEAKSMTSGYNEAMKSSDARYKIYLHQDVFIVNRNFIYDILACFKGDESVGMIGIAGTKHLPDNADAWKSLDVGGCYSIGTFSGAGYIAVKPEINNPLDCFQEVEFVDGMLMATAYDLEWDERIDGFHFYDVAQCENFRKCGLKTAVARQNDIWTFHDFGPLNLETYNVSRKKFCDLYTEYDYKKGDVQDYAKIYQMCDTIAATLKPLFDSQQYNEINNVLKEIDNAIYFNEELLMMYFMMEIHMLEKMMGFNLFMNMPYADNKYKCVEAKYLKLKWISIRATFAYESVEHVVNMIVNGIYSIEAVIVVVLHNIPQQNMGMLDEIGAGLGKSGFVNADEWRRTICMVKEYERKNVPLAEGL